jgi:hypothetical protein
MFILITGERDEQVIGRSRRERSEAGIYSSLQFLQKI